MLRCTARASCRQRKRKKPRNSKLHRRGNRSSSHNCFGLGIGLLRYSHDHDAQRLVSSTVLSCTKYRRVSHYLDLNVARRPPCPCTANSHGSWVDPADKRPPLTTHVS